MNFFTNLFKEKVPFSDEEVRILVQNGYSVNTFSAFKNCDEPQFYSHKRITKFHDVFEASQRTETLLAMGFADVDTYRSSSSENCLSLEEALNYLK